ncbi:MAG TPA: DUF4405 domain-containing protein [Desulfobacteraceae bacterium]|nr:DUF4405 domain-containing protein [Desulfobacteraceae bacterium]
MKMRKITSLVALLSFIVLVVNSVVLYIAPHGRVADWAVWRVMGLTKDHWSDQHVIVGVLFLLAIFLHIYYNWKPITSYLKNKVKRIKVFTREFNIALIVTIVCIAGSYHPVPPFSWVLDFSESVKNAAEAKYGSRPFGGAEVSSLKAFVSRTGLDLDRAMAGLRDAGIVFESESETLKDIAEKNRISPQQIYTIMKTAGEPETSEKTVVPEGTVHQDAAPAEATAGLGKLTLAEVIERFNLDEKAVFKKLAEKGVSAKPGDKMKAVAEKSGVSPTELYQLMQ